MTDTSFTPGPWGASVTSFIRSNNNHAVASVYGREGNPAQDEVMIANAHLIAAAPDLYEALEEAPSNAAHAAYDFCRRYIGSEHEDAIHDFVENQVRKSVFAALAKARGEA